MINNSFTKNAQSKKQGLIAKILFSPIFFFLLFQANVYSQNSGNCLRMLWADPANYVTGTGIPASFTALTIEAWVNLDDVDGDHIGRIVSVGFDAAVLRHETGVGGINFYLNFSGSITQVYSAGILTADKWAHVAGTWDGSTMRLYVNGKEIGSHSVSGTLSTDGSISISRNSDEQMRSGYVDEIRLWNIARTGDQIRSNMYKELSGSESGLINYWKLNETDGSTAIDSKGSVNLTLYNIGSRVNSGAFAGPRNALSFDGTNAYVSIADNSSLHLSNTITIEAWVYPTNLTGRFSIYSTRRNNDAGSYQLEVGNGDVGTWSNRVSVSGIGTWIAQTYDNAISPNVWSHIVYIRSGTGAGTHKIYVNGVEQTLISDDAYSFVDNSSVKLIGTGTNLANDFAGQIDEVRIWNDVRTQSEIAGNMCMTLKGNETGLAGYWRFDQVAGTLAPDLTDNHNDGTLNNMTDDDWVSASEFNTWVGLNGSNFWNSAGINWSLGNIPTSSDNVGIPNADPGGYAFTLYVDANKQCRNLCISSTASLELYNYSLTVSGNVLSAGTLTGNSASEKIIFSGGSSIHDIYSSSSLSLYDVEVNDAYGAKLLSNCTINHALTLTNGDFDLNGYNITLGSNAALTESAGNTVKGTSGKISITKNIGVPTNANVGGLGAVITSTSNLGSTIVERTHSAAAGSGNQGILRKYKIQPVTNSGLAATLRFYYDESELNSISESNLSLFKSPDGTDNSWNTQNGNANSTDNYVELTGINDFSYWTLGNNASPLPVELSSFTANTVGEKVSLNWKTETEVNNYGFEIERSVSSSQSSVDSQSQNTWEKIGFIQGHGNSNSQKDYSFTDENPSDGIVNYRLKQIDNDGKIVYSQEIEVEIIPLEVALYQNFPNPFNPTTAISYQLSAVSNVMLKVYDVLGKEVATLVNEKQNAGVYKIAFDGSKYPSGVYFYRITTGDFVQTKKLLLLK